jgi:NTP pyrophosphatase (non-canonical NTP hydrolase)
MSMTMDEYQKGAISTLTHKHEYGDVSAQLMAQVLGLVGESGEVAEKFKKLLRDKDGKLSAEDRAEIVKELGDILWYVASVSELLGANIEMVASSNLEKLQSRKTRDQIHGSGDNR